MTTAASVSAGPPVPSMSVAPTSAMPSTAPRLQPRRSNPLRTTCARQRLAWITGRVVVEDLPALGPSLHHQGEGTARGEGVSPLKNVSGGNQRQRGTQAPHGDFFEVEAVPAGTRREPGSIIASDKVESAPGS